MRTLRTRTVGILGALAVLIWAGAASASTISMVWISASGGSGVGTSTLTGVNIGDTAVLAINVTVSNVTGGISGLGIRAQYNSAVATATAITNCPPISAGGNNFFGPASCGAFGFNAGGAAGFLSVATSSLNSIAGTPPQGHQSGTLVVAGIGGSQSNGATWQLAQITFMATGAGTTGNFFFRPGVDGEVGAGGGFSFPTATGFSISVIPEPGTFAMLALGLGALAFAGRRR